MILLQVFSNEKRVIILGDTPYAPLRWIIPSNKKYFDSEAAFAKLHEINWKQSFKANIGDIVYIYVTAPVKAIKFKCVVTKTDLAESEIWR